MNAAPLPWATEPLPADPSAFRIYSVPMRESDADAGEVAIVFDAADADLIVSAANATADARTRLARTLVDHFPHGYTCGEHCTYAMNSPHGWAGHAADAFLNQEPPR